MKALFIISLISMSTLLHAKTGQSIVTIVCNDSKPFGASINDSEFSYSKKHINFSRLTEGEHYLEVYRSSSLLPESKQKMYTIFKGFIHVPANVQLIFTIDHRSKLVLTETFVLNTPTSQLFIQGLDHNPIIFKSIIRKGMMNDFAQLDSSEFVEVNHSKDYDMRRRKSTSEAIG
jgi:hypothetical protein